MAWERRRVLESVGVREGRQERGYVRRRLLLLLFKGGYGPSWPTDGVRRYGVYKRVVILWMGRGGWVGWNKSEKARESWRERWVRRLREVGGNRLYVQHQVC